MDITFNCAQCGQHIAIDASGAGLQVRCPTCGKGMFVPEQVVPTTHALKSGKIVGNGAKRNLPTKRAYDVQLLGFILIVVGFVLIAKWENLVVPIFLSLSSGIILMWWGVAVLKSQEKTEEIKLIPHPPFPSGVEDRIRAEFTPGEMLLALCDFDQHTLGMYHLTLAVTNINLRIFNFQSSETQQHLTILYGRDALIGNTVISLQRISRITEQKKKQASTPVLRLSIWWDGGVLELGTPYQEGETFVTQLKLAHTKCVAQGSSPAVGIGEELEKLAQLSREGVLSPDEWTRAKELFLGKPISKRESAIRSLRNLYELHKDGALSESEFRMKKWDILSRKEV